MSDQSEIARKTLLVVDDDPVNRRALKRAFEGDYIVHEAEDGAGALEVARRVRPDVLVSDQRMPNMNGIELFAKLKDELPHSVRVLVTGHHDYSAVVDAVNAARVHHYLEKPFHTTDLRAIVAAYVQAEALRAERERLAQELEHANKQLAERGAQLEQLVASRTAELAEANRRLSQANARLREKAARDELTNLFNRRALLDQLDLELQRSKRYQRTFSLLFIDVDNFKQINDGYGHAAGDLVLRTLANRFLSADEGVRGSDYVARLGGEEFCILLPETGQAGARVKAERLRRAAEVLNMGEAGPKDLRITVSIGVASYPEHGINAEQLLRAADEAQYVAKRSGKNRVSLAGSS